jgi:hypothetical protein
VTLAVMVAFGGTISALAFALVNRSGPSPSEPRPIPQAYVVRFPTSPDPGGDGPTGVYTITATTNLPDQTRLGVFVLPQGGGGYGDYQHSVRSGRIWVSVVNNNCSIRGGRLVGSSLEIRFLFTATPPFSGGLGATPSPPAYQPESVLAILGQRFERLKGPQFKSGRPIRSPTYHLPADTCIGLNVRVPDGDRRHVELPTQGSPIPAIAKGISQDDMAWGVYTFVGDPDGTGYRDAINHLESIGLRRGVDFSERDVACDQGATEALGRSGRAVAVYFRAEPQAYAFASLLDSPVGVARVQIACPD